MEAERKIELEKTASQTEETVFTDDELKKMQADVENTVKEFNTDDNISLQKALDQVASIGRTESRRAGEQLKSLKTPIAELMNKNDNSEVPDNLMKLRKNVEELNPSILHQKGLKKLYYKVSGKNPLKKYMVKKQSVEKNIDSIIKSLLTGRDKLQEDNVDLKMIKEKATEQIKNLKKQVEFGNRINERLEVELDSGKYEGKEHVINEAREKVLVRVKNMQQQINVLHQSLASVDLIRKNNEKLFESINNAIDTTQNVATVTAAIHIALQNQKKVMKAVKSVNETTENMILANSRMLKENTEETTKMLENPTLSIEKLKESFDNIYEAIKIQEQSSERIITSSKESIRHLEKLNSSIERKLTNGN